MRETALTNPGLPKQVLHADYGCERPAAIVVLEGNLAVSCIAWGCYCVSSAVCGSWKLQEFKSATIKRSPVRATTLLVWGVVLCEAWCTLLTTIDDYIDSDRVLKKTQLH